MTSSELARPTASQIAWKDLECGMFLHLEHAKESKPGEKVPPAAEFNPEKLDTDQWMEAAKAFGARIAVFTAKHAGGFCMWPTEGLDYGVKQSSFRGGKGDIVGEFVNSCHKYGIEPGIYVMYQPNYYHGWIGREWTGTNEGFEEYQQIFEIQLTELCTRYGKLAELWFDGGFPTEEGVWRYGYDNYPRGPRVTEILEEQATEILKQQTCNR